MMWAFFVLLNSRSYSSGMCLFASMNNGHMYNIVWMIELKHWNEIKRLDAHI